MSSLDELMLLKALGETWTYVDQSTGKPVTISWAQKLQKLNDRKDDSIIRRLTPSIASTLSRLMKAGAPDRELIEFLGAGAYSLGLAFKHLKEIGLLPLDMPNRWRRSRKTKRIKPSCREKRKYSRFQKT